MAVCGWLPAPHLLGESRSRPLKGGSQVPGEEKQDRDCRGHTPSCSCRLEWVPRGEAKEETVRDFADSRGRRAAVTPELG